MAQRIRTILALSCIVSYSFAARLPQLSVLPRLVKRAAVLQQSRHMGCLVDSLLSTFKSESAPKEIQWHAWKDLLHTERSPTRQTFDHNMLLTKLQSWLRSNSGIINKREEGTGQTLLHWATRLRYSWWPSGDAVEMLIKHGADVSARDSNGRTPFDWAIESQNSGAVALLLATGVSADKPKDSANTLSPLQCAIINGDFATVQALLQAGADSRWLYDEKMLALVVSKIISNLDLLHRLR